MSAGQFADFLVPTDGSDTADAALGVALSLASRTGATVHVLSVVNPYVLSEVTEAEEQIEAAEAVVEAAAARGREAGVDVETEVREGAEHEAIGEYVGERGVDAVVMGTHGRTGVGRVLMGSVTERVVRTADVPVLTVRGESPAFEPNRVLLATDGSDAAHAAERVALRFAEDVGATVDVLGVVDTATLATVADPVVDADGAVRTVVDLLEGQAVEAVEAVEAAAESSGVAVETLVAEGRPHERILAAAADRDADLIVVGTHGRGGLKRVVLGSVAEKVLRLADRPVLVVPADGSGESGG